MNKIRKTECGQPFTMEIINGVLVVTTITKWLQEDKTIKIKFYK